MKNKKIILLFILVLLISIFGVSFALYNYNKTSKSSKLIVGDIYMHYKESDMSILTTAEDTSRFYYNGYLLNPNMKNQEYQELDTRNELSKCVDYFNKYEPNEGETSIDFCRGTGTFYGSTFQTHLDNNNFDNTMLTELKELNIVTSDNKINSIMASQTYEEKQEVIDTRNELSKCADYFNKIGINYDSGTTGITYCQGTGTAYGGYTLQQNINDDQLNESQLIELKN